MDTRLVLTHRLDIPAARHIASLHPEAQVVVVCPHLADRCESEGLRVQLLQLPVGDPVQQAYAEARRVARTLQRRADAVLATVDDAAPGCDWLQTELFYLSYTMLGYRALWQRVLAQLPAARWLVLVAETPFRYGAHSCLPALALLELRGLHGHSMQAFSHPQPELGQDLLPDLHASAAAGDPAVLSHLPTCFYDHAHFEQVLVERAERGGGSCLNLPAPHYDVPMPRLAGAPMQSLDAALSHLDPAQALAIDTAAEQLEADMREALNPLVASPRYRAPQARALAQAWRRLMLFSALLRQRFDGRPPRSLLLSNHDTGLHGPLLSLARRHRARVVLVPHSKIFNAPVPAVPGLDLRCATHPVQGLPIHDAAGRAVETSLLAFPETLGWQSRPPRPLRTLGVLLSGVSYNGLCGADLPRFVRGLAQLREWASARGVACRIRCKPSEPLLALLTQGLGMPADALLADMAGTLADFIAASDLCLSYDVPTSASVELLRTGVPTLHVVLRPQMPEEEALVHAAIVPRVPPGELLPRLDTFHSDPAHLWQFGRDQFQAYVRAWATARPLSTLL